jgi:hypothetical protein
MLGGEAEHNPLDFTWTLMWRKPEYPEKTIDLSQVTDKHYHINVVSSTPSHERGSNSHLLFGIDRCSVNTM